VLRIPLLCWWCMWLLVMSGCLRTCNNRRWVQHCCDGIRTENQPISSHQNGARLWSVVGKNCCPVLDVRLDNNTCYAPSKLIMIHAHKGRCLEMSCSYALPLHKLLCTASSRARLRYLHLHVTSLTACVNCFCKIWCWL
jgi:hypothetical protein